MKCRKLSFGMSPSPPPEKGARSRSKQEGRKAELSDPAGQEEDCVGFGEVGWRERHRGVMEEVTNMIERHDNHGCAAQRVHTGQAAV